MPFVELSPQKGGEFMKINLLEIIKSLPIRNYDKLGNVIGFVDIFNYLKTHYAIDNQDLICSYLDKLENDGLIKIHRLEDDNDKLDLIIAIELI